MTLQYLSKALEGVDSYDLAVFEGHWTFSLTIAGTFMFATLSCNQKSSSFPEIDLLAVRADFLFLVFKKMTIFECYIAL